MNSLYVSFYSSFVAFPPIFKPLNRFTPIFLEAGGMCNPLPVPMMSPPANFRNQKKSVAPYLQL